MESASKKLSLVRAYKLYKKISAYPNLIDDMRITFLSVLEEKGITSGRELENRARELLKEDGLEASEENLREYGGALIDLFFASHIEKTEDYINLARKQERARELVRILGAEASSSSQIYNALEEFCAIPKGEVYISPDEAEGIRVALINQFISSQLPFIGVAKYHTVMRDVYTVLQHTRWNKKRFGKLGGKAAGMILARNILLPTLSEHDPELEKHLTMPETWYLNSDLFVSFLERNGLFFTRTHKYKDREEIEREFSSIVERFREATFAEEMIDNFRSLLEEIGEYPIIIRSSSYLEDSFGLAFSGKYDSVFVSNQGSLETRLETFIKAVKQVLASMYNTDPILYRREHGLLDFNEQMAMIVQKVVGRRWGDYFFPLASGVLFSFNAYRWTKRIQSEKGLARIVFGLGTRAVDRVGSDYPRMVALSHPELRPEISAQQISKYSQRQVDLLNLRKGCFETVDFDVLRKQINHPDLFFAVSVVKEGEIAPPLFKNQDFENEALCITFDKLIHQSLFLPLVRKILSRLEEAYGHPVDVEFVWDDNKFYLLQCRTLSTRKEMGRVSVPKKVPREETLFSVHSGLSDSLVKDLEYIIYVDPKAYNEIKVFEDKVKIMRIVSGLNHYLLGKRFALMGPGRWGSNDINLGVQVKYGDIKNARLLVEIAFAQDGLTPEVSYGTHFFQDLVESDISIFPIFPDNPQDFLNEEYLLQRKNRLGELLPEYGDLDRIVHVIHVPSESPGKLLQVVLDGRKQEGVGYFDGKDG